MIIPFPAGGSTDVIGRLVAEGLRAVLGQPVVVDNRAGAGGSLGTAAIAKAAPDGYTIGMGTASTLAINPATYKSLPFDVLDDLAPIGNIAAVPNIMSVHPAVKAATMAEFIALAKSQPGKLSYASPGFGSVGHLLGEQFKLATGTDILHVPYRGMGPALNDAIGGQVQVIYDNLPTSLELVKSGKLRGARRCRARSASRRLPDVPTFGELGLDDINWMAFFGLIAPKDTPAPIVRRLNEALVRVLAMPEHARQARGAAGHRRRQFAGGLQGRDRPRAGAHEARGRGGQDRAELARRPRPSACPYRGRWPRHRRRPGRGWPSGPVSNTPKSPDFAPAPAGLMPTDASPRRNNSRTAAARLGIRCLKRKSSKAANSSGESMICRRSPRVSSCRHETAPFRRSDRLLTRRHR